MEQPVVLTPVSGPRTNTGPKTLIKPLVCEGKPHEQCDDVYHNILFFQSDPHSHQASLHYCQNMCDLFSNVDEMYS